MRKRYWLKTLGASTHITVSASRPGRRTKVTGKREEQQTSAVNNFRFAFGSQPQSHILRLLLYLMDPISSEYIPPS